MGLTTQICGNNRQKTQELTVLFTEADIVVRQPYEDIISEELAIDTSGVHYMAELELFQFIDASAFHTLDNDEGAVDLELALQLIYAMSKSKPIVITELPAFTADVDFTIRDIIYPRLHQIHLIDVHHMDPATLKHALQDLPKTVDYALSTAEKHQIRLYGKTHFRELLHQPGVLALA